MNHKRFFIVAELDNECNHLCYHEFEASDYRSLVSLNAFFWGLKDYNKSKTRLYIGYRKSEWERFYKRTSNLTAPFIIHDTIWDFYIHIGYDYKKKKYITT